MNKSDSTDLILSIIAAFCLLVVVIVGYRCCRRRRSAGKKKTLQRQWKKRTSREKKGEEDTTLLREITHNADEDSSSQAKDKKINTSPGSNQKKTKRNGKSCTSPDPSEGSSKAHKKIKNCENKRSTSPTILGKIKLRSGDTESSNHSSVNSTRQTSPSANTSNSMNKKREQNKGDRNLRTSNLTEQSSYTKNESTRKTHRSECSIKLSPRMRASGDPLGCTDARANPAPSKKTALLEGFVKDKPKECGKRKNTTGSGCIGTECKKCKPYEEDDMSNVSQPGGLPSPIVNTPKPTKEAWLEETNEDPAMSVSDGVNSPEANSSPRSPSSIEDDYVTVTIDKLSERPGNSMEVSLNSTESDYEMSEDSSAHEIGRTDQKALDDIFSMDPSPSKDTKSLNPSRCKGAGLLRSSPCKDGELAHPSVHKNGVELEPSIRKEKELFVNYTDPSVSRATTRIESIGDVYDVMEYATREWKGDTTKAHAIREGYFEVPKILGLNNLRVIRGDNYCAIRATLFQALVKRLPVLEKFKNIQQIPKQLLSEGHNWIEDWNFGARLHIGRNEVCKGMEDCLTELVDLVNLNNRMEGEGRVSHLLSFFNYKPIDYELRLLEAVKLLMMASAVELHKLVTSEQDAPVFAIIMFARDSSPDPHQFMKKHLNAVGDAGGLEQVEMHLLGYTLGITIRVVRPSCFGQSDFIACYPEDMPRGTPSVTLVAEDDRHYNVLG